MKTKGCFRASFPFYGLMTGCTVGNQVAQLVGTSPVSIKGSPRFDVMNIQCLASNILAKATSLACISISRPGSLSLLVPIGATPVSVPANPGRTILCRSISRSFLPLQTALGATEVVLAKFRWTTFKLLAASVAFDEYAVVLRVGWPLHGILMQPSEHTLLAAEMVVQSLKSALLMLRRATAIITGDRDTRRPSNVTTGSRTIILSRMVPRRLKQSVAILTVLGEYLAPRFIRTCDRAEANSPICPFLDWLSTMFTRFDHVSIIP